MVPAIVIFCTRTEASMLITAGQAVKKFKEDFLITCRNECTMEHKNLFSMLPIMDRNFVG